MPYAAYDLYDLGEFDQKGSVRTKYGTRDEFLEAVKAVQAAGMHAYADKQTYLAFIRTNTIFCSCSAPRLPDELIQTNDEVYIRFHGTSRWYRHNYTSEELTIWAKRIVQHNPARVWGYFNNDFGGHAIENARELTHQLSTAHG